MYRQEGGKKIKKLKNKVDFSLRCLRRKSTKEQKKASKKGEANEDT